MRIFMQIMIESVITYRNMLRQSHNTTRVSNEQSKISTSDLDEIEYYRTKLEHHGIADRYMSVVRILDCIPMFATRIHKLGNEVAPSS